MTMPTYLDLKFDTAETALIAVHSVGGALDWSCKGIRPIRKKVRNLHRLIQGDMCCYCRKQFHQDHDLAVDVEHILPQSSFPDQVLEPVNLSVACKRCNMGIKGCDYSFVHGASPAQVVKGIFRASQYEIIHPNLDCYSAHIAVLSVRVTGVSFHRYKVLRKSAKGQKTVEYFRLRDLEIEQLDAAQGIRGVTQRLRAVAINAILRLS
ncbi:HNH endonuclease domain-containing protein [Xanthomonas sp. CFBP 7698]|uniref:HNH endonuclease n=1 Tax=unclassified Xanthomonas TaxID=2643310 RepID=UPI000EDC7522|nr:HNH endonuclease domain-containing protein [Xanthomonas sp. CFBP 7698]RJS02676.1 hypothetical protein XnspCFBP7698_13825 [Xanthomonas sp. CFBP 7698]